MRFTLATVVLSLTSMVIAIPTELKLFARDNVPTCNQGQKVQCCLKPAAANGGLLGNALDLGCEDVVVDLLGGILGGIQKCNGQFACCGNSEGDSNGGVEVLSGNCILQNVAL